MNNVSKMLKYVWGFLIYQKIYQKFQMRREAVALYLKKLKAKAKILRMWKSNASRVLIPFIRRISVSLPKTMIKGDSETPKQKNDRVIRENSLKVNNNL